MKHKQAQKLKYNANKLCVKLACIMIMAKLLMVKVRMKGT